MTHRAQRKPLIFADSPLLLEIQACNRREPKDFRGKPQETADWGLSPQVRHLRSVTFSSALSSETLMTMKGLPLGSLLAEPPGLSKQRSSLRRPALSKASGYLYILVAGYLYILVASSLDHHERKT